ncbi:MAG: asparagine synthase (glutamine-hydrolyzing) [Nibricoccus sp.]
MCGIAGFISSEYLPETRRAAVERMCAAMQRRGPDDSGVMTSPNATLGMRRLAIFDPLNSRQPMATEDGRYQIVFNGAIYNFRELRVELEKTGTAFNTQGDTEVLLAAYAHWGVACLQRLRGMFAFAIWDTQDHTLFLARDPFGIKPLYYAHDGGTLLFASELNALTASRIVPVAIDPAALNAALSYLAVPAPHTIYQGLLSLRPGECALLKGSTLSIRTYWSFNDANNANVDTCRTERRFQRELRERLEDTIHAHSLADVPVGAFLSGGLDSSALVALMQRATSGKLKTFSIGFNEAAYSEATEAEAAAKHFGTEHHTHILTGEQVASDIESILATYDQPSGDAINTYYISQVARDGGVTVALSGLGGDELFGGYPWFKTTPKLARWLPWWRRLPSLLRDHILVRLQQGDARARKLADFLRHGRNIHELAALQRRNFSEAARRNLLNGDIRYTPHPELVHLPAELADADPTEIVSAWEMRTYMGDVLLRDSDVMSMRHSLELRVPFVDRPFVEWIWNQRTRYKHTPKHPKQALAHAVRDLLPPGIAKREKRGFTLPLEQWMRGPLRPFLDEIFTLENISRSGLFDGAGVQGAWHGFINGDDPREWSRVWTLAIAVAFVNRAHQPVATSK